MSANPEQLGARVLAGLAIGRAKAIAQAKERGAYVTALVRDLAEQDARAGKPARGRAGRIRRKLHGMLSERHVKRILDGQTSASDSLVSNRTSEGENACTN